MTTNTNPATPKQTFALFIISGYDVRACGLTVVQASELIDKAKKGDASDIAKLPGAVLKREVKPKTDWRAVWDKAYKAGIEAGKACIPTPMVVSQHTNPLDDKSKVEKQWLVNDGCCGFAEIVVTPGTSSFAKWLTSNKLARKHYYGGVSYWVHEFNQSLARKEAFASATCKVLSDNGISCHVSSRMD